MSWSQVVRIVRACFWRGVPVLFPSRHWNLLVDYERERMHVVRRLVVPDGAACSFAYPARESHRLEPLPLPAPPRAVAPSRVVPRFAVPRHESEPLHAVPLAEAIDYLAPARSVPIPISLATCHRRTPAGAADGAQHRQAHGGVVPARNLVEHADIHADSHPRHAKGRPVIDSSGPHGILASLLISPKRTAKNYNFLQSSTIFYNLLQFCAIRGRSGAFARVQASDRSNPTGRAT